VTGVQTCALPIYGNAILGVVVQRLPAGVLVIFKNGCLVSRKFVPRVWFKSSIPKSDWYKLNPNPMGDI